MNHRVRIAASLPVLVLAALAATPSAAQEEEDGAPPEARAIAREAAAHVAGLPAFAFSWFVSHDEVLDGREKLTFLRSGQTLMVRGEGFVSRTELEADRRDFYFDGTAFTVSAPEEDFYATAAFEGSFEELVEAAEARTGTVLPLWTLMSSDLPDRIAPEDGEVSSAYVGLTRIAGTPAHHIAFASEQEDWQLWISADTANPLPLMIVGTRRDEQGWPQYRAYLTDWDLDPEVEPGTFTFVPDENDRPAAMPRLVEDGSGETPAADGTADVSDDGEEPQ